MKLETVEKKLGLTYPQAFREIYESGAMCWMCGIPQAKSHLFPNKMLEPESYPYWNLLEFSTVEWSSQYLLERVQEAGGRWKEGVRILPFAWDDEGDAYFFDAALEDPAAPVFSWMRSFGEAGLVNRSFENFICSHLCEPVLNRGLPANHWWVQNQLRWLTPEHRDALTSGDPEALEKLFSATDCWENTDYISY
ncbi:SMI1/KNR4 family protein [Oscillospiraceae bacterium 38-13]|jgi:hypothetical protein